MNEQDRRAVEGMARCGIDLEGLCASFPKFSKEDKRIYTFSHEKPFKAVVRMSVPLIAGMFIMVMYNFVDTYFIGLTRDDYQLAAVSLAYPVMMGMTDLVFHDSIGRVLSLL